jgi:AcrR family transcriptional regulator
MSSESSGSDVSDTAPRPTLTRQRVLEGAVNLADEIGIEALTIRKLADSLGTRPMTIYHYVPSKDEIVDGMVEMVFAEIELPSPDEDWQPAIRKRCVSAREVLKRHPWAAPLMESRTAPGPMNLAHHEAVLACLRRGGLSFPLMAHAYAILDSFVYGYAFEESVLPFDTYEDIRGLAAQIMASFPADTYPAFAEFTKEHVLQPGYRFADSFDFGLDLIIDGLAAAARKG